jgi:biotin operon repressor
VLNGSYSGIIGSEVGGVVKKSYKEKYEEEEKVLKAIIKKPMTGPQIAEVMRLSKGEVSRVISKLRKKGAVISIRATRARLHASAAALRGMSADKLSDWLW